MANATPVAKNAPKNAPAKPLTKSQLKAKLAEKTGLPAKQVAEVLDALAEVAVAEVNRKGVGSFTIPSLCKVVVVNKKATPEKKMISPLTKTEITVKAKPARRVVKVRPLKALKDAVQ